MKNLRKLKKRLGVLVKADLWTKLKHICDVNSSYK